MLLLLYLREFLVLCSAQIVLEAYAQRLCGLIGLAVNFEEEFFSLRHRVVCLSVPYVRGWR